ncbi:MAG: ABC transporter permease, partial [Chloroflexota bacterium]|nr:ABC transporter permease [Chloroflexota bacterium]
MNLTESFLTALDSLTANKLRAVLTMLGVIIGVASVIALVSIGDGVNSKVTSEIQAMGTNLLMISTNLDKGLGPLTLSLSDVEALRDPLNTPAVAEVAPAVQGTREVVYGGRSVHPTVFGVSANYFEVNNLTEIQVGDLLTEADDEERARVAVLGSQTALDLFGESYPVGE